MFCMGLKYSLKSLDARLYERARRDQLCILELQGVPQLMELLKLRLTSPYLFVRLL